MSWISIPVAARTRAMKAGPLAASRMAAVATANTRFAPAPRATALKSLSASMARAMAESPRACPLSTSLTRRRAARVVARMRSMPAASRRYTTTRPEFEPMSMTATASSLSAGCWSMPAS
jgi:hypothetical protein